MVPSAPRPPSFDVVRINPQGDAVIAGRATPEAQVHVLDGEREITYLELERQSNRLANLLTDDVSALGQEILTAIPAKIQP